MNVGEASRLLAKMYLKAPDKEKVLSIHLFGILYANELDGIPIKEVVLRAELPVSYQTEVRKGMRLAKYVNVVSKDMWGIRHL